jgi:integrase
MAGVAPQVVQMRLGHESLHTTSTVYAHLLLEEQAAAVKAIGWDMPSTVPQ